VRQTIIQYVKQLRAYETLNRYDPKLAHGGPSDRFEYRMTLINSILHALENYELDDGEADEANKR